jgi:Zn-dependent protease/predicted transcriptional regulator
MARRLGVAVRQITLFIFGGVSEMDQNSSRTPSVEFFTTIAGPVSSFGLAAVFLGLGHVLGNSANRIIVEMIHYLAYVNLLLGAFNLIPGFPLDGGRVLRSYLWHRTGDLRRATKSAARVGEVFAMLLMGLGFVAAIGTHIITGVWLFLVGLFLKSSAQNEYQSFELRVGLKDVRLRDIMTPAVAVDSSMTISEFINDYVFHYHHRLFPVLEMERFIGMIDLRSIKHVPPEDWAATKIGGYLSDPATYWVLDPDIEAMEAFRLFMTHNVETAPIVRNGTLMGILTRSDLLKVVTLKREIAA